MQVLIFIALLIVAVHAASNSKRDRYQCGCKATCLGGGDPHFVNFDAQSFEWTEEANYTMLQAYGIPEIFFGIGEHFASTREYITGFQSGDRIMNMTQCEEIPEMKAHYEVGMENGVRNFARVHGKCVRRYDMWTLDVYVIFMTLFTTPVLPGLNFLEVFIRKSGATGICTQNHANSSHAHSSSFAQDPICKCHERE